MRRAIGPPGSQHFQQPNCARCGLARFTITDREIGPLCSFCAEQPTKETSAMARTMRASTMVDENGNEIEQEPTRRGRPAKHPLPMGGNVTDGTIEEFGKKALAAKNEAEKKRDEAKSLDGVFRNILKSAKDAGVDPDAVRWWLKARKMEPDDLNREIAWQNRMALVMRLPIGTQLGIDLSTGETIASQIDEKQTRKRGGGKGKAKEQNGADPRAAYIAGYDAGKAGKSAKSGSRGITGEAAVEFQKGWQQGMKDAAKEHGPESTMQ